MAVPFLDLTRQYEAIREEIGAAVSSVLQSQQFILGDQVGTLEGEVAGYVGTSHAIGVASGTDALLLTLRALGIGPGDEVLVPSFTFFATAGAVVHVGADPVFVDIDPHGFGLDPGRLEERITARTRAVVVVHLFGQCAELEPIRSLAERHGLLVIEDAAQAIGAQLAGAKAGSMARAGCFSFFPTKNLGGAGDGGMIVTSDPLLDGTLRRLRMHGAEADYRHHTVGYNSRLDALQAAILRAKLPHLDEWNEARRRNAARYREGFEAAGVCGTDQEAPVRLPVEGVGRLHVYHQYVIRARRRDELRRFMTARGIGTAVYYPVPLHQQECFRSLPGANRPLRRAEEACREVLALPIFPELTGVEQEAVVDAVSQFYRRARPGKGPFSTPGDGTAA